MKSVERNALNMYEARKCLLGLESSGVTIATSLSPASCPAGLACPSLDILASAGLGLTGLGIKFIVVTGGCLSASLSFCHLGLHLNAVFSLLSA